ncbi:MAG TPA: amidase [Beijerinckiaceae bacterium]|jgi:Asp-tRNA(Asn)/Glu-tRNA(Gln) amidotransferase A subunit family amidase
MHAHDYLRHDGIGLAALIRSREVSAEEVLEAALARLDAVNPAINAVVYRAEDLARARLREPLDGPFAGVPFLVKDLSLTVKGLPQTNGSRFWQGYVPDADATLAERHRAAGLVTLGRTASTEMGLGPVTEPAVHGPCRNPWDPSRQSAGSSGGSAAAVAAGITPLAHATDGGGSIRMPASHCGLFGLKPSRGRLPAGPVLGEGWSGLAVPHAVTRSVRDSAALLDATAGPAPGDPYAAPGAGPYLSLLDRDPAPLRIAVTLETPDGRPVHPEVRAAVERTARLLEELGHHVEPRAIPVDLEAFYAQSWTISGANAAAAVSARAKVLGRAPREDELEPATRAIIERARHRSAEDYARAVQWLHGFGRQVGAFFQRYDLALSPVFTNPPLPVGSLSMGTADFETYNRMLMAERPFTAIYNASGGPAMSLPLHWTADGLPVGVQVGADLGRENRLLQLAGQIERAAPWTHRYPAEPAARQAA